jgi:hypothetical protein
MGIGCCTSSLQNKSPEIEEELQNNESIHSKASEVKIEDDCCNERGENKKSNCTIEFAENDKVAVLKFEEDELSELNEIPLEIPSRWAKYEEEAVVPIKTEEYILRGFSEDFKRQIVLNM